MKTNFIKYRFCKKRINLFANAYLFLLILLCCQCQTDSVFEKDAFKTVFERYQVQGSFGYYNNSNGNFYIHNLKEFRDSPQSVGKSVQLLLALEALDFGLLTPSQEIYFNFENHHDRTSQYDVSINQLISLIPYQKFRNFQDSLQYGKAIELNQYQADFVEHALKLTADEQLGFIKKLFFMQLPFQKRTQELIKSKFIKYSDSLRIYHYFLGSASQSDNAFWAIGWVEEQGHPAFFVMNLKYAPHIDNIPFIPFLQELITKM